MSSPIPTPLSKKTEAMPPNRRALLKLLAAGGGAALLATLPHKWLAPVVEVGVLPAHAKLSTKTAVPFNLTASPVSAYEIRLDWNCTPLTAGHSYQNYSSFQVLKWNAVTSTFYVYSQVSIDLNDYITDSFFYIDQSLPPLSTHRYQVRANVGRFYESRPSNEASATTLDGPPLPTATPTPTVTPRPTATPTPTVTPKPPTSTPKP